MAKTIKFNLICNDNPVRTIEDLRENFSVEDLLNYYRNGLLQKWLEVREYEKELKKVTNIKSEDSLEIIRELIKIFGITSDKKKIEESVYMIKFLDERKELCSKYEQNEFKVKNIIEEYQYGFNKLVLGIDENPNDVARIKANIEELVMNYKWALDLYHRELFWTLHNKKSVLAIMCLLMNDKTRDYFLPVELKESIDNETNQFGILGSTKKKYDVDVNPDKREMYKNICLLLTQDDFAYLLGDDLIKFAGVTEGYWKDLEPKGKRYMIIRMGIGDFVRPAGVSGGDLSSADVENAFVILDGIDYKSNSVSRQLWYMEV